MKLRTTTIYRLLAIWMAILLLGSLLVIPAEASPTVGTEQQEPGATQTVNITVKGKPLKQRGIQGEEGVLVPLELIHKGLKLPVKYDANNKAYTIRRQNVTVQLQPGEGGAKATVNGSTQIFPYEWKEIGGKPYVSVKVLTDHLGYTSQWNAATKTLDLVPHRMNDIKVSTVSIIKSIPEATINVQYPQVSGLRNKAAEKRINTLLKSKADTFVENALKEAKASQPSPNGSKYEYLGNYTVTYNRDGMLSILEQTYAYTGGAHGNSVREGLNFRLSDGKLVPLDELLRANPQYRNIVDPSIKKQFEQTEGYFGNFTTIGPNPSYYLKDNGVVIFFQLYEYVPYVNGFAEFYFPFTELLPAGANPFDFKV